MGRCPGQYQWTLIRHELGRWGIANHPGRPRAGLLAVAHNDHVTPPSVSWQVTPPPSTPPRRSPTKYGSGDQTPARFEKAFAKSYEVNRRCRCWAWLILGEGGCTVRSDNSTFLHSRPAASQRRGFFLGIASRRRDHPPPPTFLLCPAHPPHGGK